MSRIHYFQRYSQRENVATNNALLLSRRPAHIAPYHEAVPNARFRDALAEEATLRAGTRRLLTEALRHGHEIGGLLLENPCPKVGAR